MPAPSGQSSVPQRKKIDPSRLRRERSEEPEFPDKGTPPVSAGPVDKVIELAFNPTREKIREVTIIDRMQGRLFPIMDTINTLFHGCIEVATYRESKAGYQKVYKQEKPGPIDIMDDMIYRVAQWQKSVSGKNLEKATDIALAETETQGDDNLQESTGNRGYEE